MSQNHYSTIIIGAGLSGLACALELQNQEHSDFLVLEQSDKPGGRIRTEEVDGYLLDEGFQVFLDSYPTAGQLLDLPALNLKKFEPGALVHLNGHLYRAMDVFRRPQHIVSGLLSPIGNIFDKLQIASLRKALKKTTIETITQRKEHTTKEHLRQSGFSERIIDTFFKSFYGGIFLERELQTSSRMFEFTFKMFTEGSATLPARGMGQIPQQLAEQLPPAHIRYHTAVEFIEGQSVYLSTGETFTADQIVFATPINITRSFLPSLRLPERPWRSVTNLYFSADYSPLGEPIIALNGDNQGLINNVAVLSDLSPHYAPEGKSLISISLLGLPNQEGLTDEIRKELRSWFGAQVDKWQHLATKAIPKALPEHLPDAAPLPEPEPPYFLCGDYLESTSIEGAIISGQKSAKKVLAHAKN